jgi:hypothetical protein
MSKSRVYTQDDGSKVSFEFGADQKLIGIKKDGNSLDPQTLEFENLQDGDDALNAYNVNKFGGNVAAYEEIIDVDTDILISQHEREEKKETNGQFVEEDFDSPPSIAYNTGSNVGDYERGDLGRKFIFFGKKVKSDIMAYPVDIDPSQDHFKITRYRYSRPDVNQSKPPRKEDLVPPFGLARINVAGDGVRGSKQLGSIILPMPKATDVNGVEWGKSDLTTSGLAALGLARGMSLGGRLTGKTDLQRMIDMNAGTGGGGGGTQLFGVEQRGLPDFFNRTRQFGQARMAQSISQFAGNRFGVDLDADTFLARTGGQVLNPNSEMLFQGPVIRDFSFKFLMFARSEDEGKEIRKIIRFLKLGMAPKFRNTVFLETPDIFTLEYKNGKSDKDQMKTVNRFNPGGLALTTMNVDYAPNGYWSAYRDSQPVQLTMELNFTELRPIYQQDQDITPEDSVGY